MSKETNTLSKSVGKTKVSNEPLELVIDNNNDPVWVNTLEILKKKLNKPSFETWIKAISFKSLEDSRVSLEVKNDFTRNFLQQSYITEIENALKEVLARKVNAHIQINENLEIERSSSIDEAEPKQISLAQINKNPRPQLIEKNDIKKELNFENYIELQSNSTALIFAKALLNNDLSYKSLFICSESGLGKTHLIHSIANEQLKLNARVKVLSAEKFTNSLIASIQRNRTQEFRDKNRNLDLLLVDDFEFIDNKKTCQEELVYTIQSITDNGGKVVIASNKGINDFKLLNNKLKSFLQGSLFAEMQKPNFDCRLKLVENLSQRKSLAISEKIQESIARKFTDNIREIEGALLQVSAIKEFGSPDTDCFTIANVFGTNSSFYEESSASIETITQKTAEYFGLSEQDLIGKSRLSDIAKARHLAIYLSHEILEISHSRVGIYFGKRKHSSIIHSIKVIRAQLASNLPSAKANQKIIDEIRNKLSL